MTDVDPFLIPVPRCIGERKRPEDWTQGDLVELSEAFTYLWRFLHDLWLRTGGATDNLQETIDIIAGGDGELPGGEDPVWEGRDWDEEIP